MTFSGDPFAVLGLPAGASEAEIKRAYRALAKRYHPDSAGERALPRFLAIQAAYDMLTSPGGRARGRAAAATGTDRGTAPGRGAPPGGPTAPPSQSDAERARATRDAFRARRTTGRPTSGAGPTGGPAWWAAGAKAGNDGPGRGPA